MPTSVKYSSSPRLYHAPALLSTALAGSGLGLLMVTIIGHAALSPPACAVTPPPRQLAQPVAIFEALPQTSTPMDFLIERPDGSRIVGTQGSAPLLGYSELLGHSTTIFLPDWLPGQPYRPNDLRLSGGMAGGKPALNMAGRYQVRVGIYGRGDQPVSYSYTVTCLVAACNGVVLYAKSGTVAAGPPQEAGFFVLPSLPPQTDPADEGGPKKGKS
ncbi:hypothetical protein [Komagataeibacter sp. FNDCR2]|uniref:hypothetical protein n=1 Tax=Komagataeibacter sp. FNDCR2 TaxID=2878682 RepID=UPI001E46D447|nr:hypothetical protein [Komagataeibacter sp. FNDCR2]MCE2574125.1 hypothetical protein [Komagataeibacter sp. FNDCR2]